MNISIRLVKTYLMLYKATGARHYLELAAKLARKLRSDSTKTLDALTLMEFAHD